MKLSVVMPVYNEINTLLEIIRRVKLVPMEKEIIIIDDFSTDGTREVLQDIHDKEIKVLFNERNRGKGYAIRKGFQAATGDIVIIQDADLEYYPDEYPQLVAKIIEGKADVVYGTRFMGARRVFNYYHYLGNKLINFVANVIYNTTLTDFMTCYKVFKADVIKSLDLKADGFGIEAEITGKIFKRGYKVYEVPISYDGRDLDEGKKIRWTDFFVSLYWLLRCWFEIYDAGEHTLYRMRLMKNNTDWIYRRIEPFLGKSIIEIGSGIGCISKYLAFTRPEKLVLTDIKDEYVEYLKHRFIGNPKVSILKLDIAQAKPEEIKKYKIDTAVCINVLEHVKDDSLALHKLYDMLEDNAVLILLVPAFKFAYGSFDKQVHHFRRYEKDELIKKLEDCGFSVEKAYYHNFVSLFGWYVNSVVLKRKKMSYIQVKMIDAVIPFIAFIEDKIKIPLGLSIITVARKNKR